MTINRKPEASLKCGVDEPQEITFTGLERDVVDVRDFFGVVFAQKAGDISSAVEYDAGV